MAESSALTTTSTGSPRPTLGSGGDITSATGRSSTAGSEKARLISSRSATLPATSDDVRSGGSARTTGTWETSNSRMVEITARTVSSRCTWTSAGRSAALRPRMSPAVCPRADRNP